MPASVLSQRNDILGALELFRARLGVFSIIVFTTKVLSSYHWICRKIKIKY